MPHPDIVARESWAHASNSYLAAATKPVYGSGIILQRVALRNSNRVVTQKETLFTCFIRSVRAMGQSLVCGNFHSSSVHDYGTSEGGDVISKSDKNASSAGPKATNKDFEPEHSNPHSSLPAFYTSLDLEMSRATLVCKVFNTLVSAPSSKHQSASLFCMLFEDNCDYVQDPKRIFSHP